MITAHARRVVAGRGERRQVRIDDATRWIAGGDVDQSLEIWLPYGPNRGLAPGRYRTQAPYALPVFARAPDGRARALEEVAITVDFERLPSTRVDLGGGYVSPGFSTPKASMYFVAADPEVGPAERVWWDDADPNPPLLTLGVVDRTSGRPASLRVRAQHQSCGRDRRDLHAGEASRDCEHAAVLFVDTSDNPHLTTGRTYRPPLSAPLVLEARRWHDPGGRALVGRLVLDVTFTQP